MTTAPRATQPVLDRAVAAAPTTAPSLLSCPVDTSASASAVIGPRGGTLHVGRFAIAIPRGAVAEPTTFTFDVPASEYLEINVHAAGVAHYFFDRAVTVTIDYSRCGGDVKAKDFDAWYIDSETRSPIAKMHGHAMPRQELFLFRTDHLSRYAIAD
ncbi:MAG TPA: hypothetical protein VFS44_11530 [Gemmatimonadaceae bacterium]|nr:hypothetical protein [Gemmatimonadaceae bacterium]